MRSLCSFALCLVFRLVRYAVVFEEFEVVGIGEGGWFFMGFTVYVCGGLAWLGVGGRAFYRSDF